MQRSIVALFSTKKLERLSVLTSSNIWGGAAVARIRHKCRIEVLIHESAPCVATAPPYSLGVHMINTLRQEMVAKAKERGICTQCLKHKALQNCRQCRRCIDTNVRKRVKRSEKYKEYQAKAYDYRKFMTQKNPLRMKIHAYAKKLGICTKCWGRPADKPNAQCALCLERRRCWKHNLNIRIGRPTMKRGRPKGKKNKTTDVRKYNRLYKKKRFYKKMQSIKTLNRAVETGGTL